MCNPIRSIEQQILTFGRDAKTGRRWRPPTNGDLYAVGCVWSVRWQGHASHCHAAENRGHIGCRLGHDTRHFNVGQYRRKQRGDDELQDASFFDHKNPVRCLLLAAETVYQCGAVSHVSIFYGNARCGPVVHQLATCWSFPVVQRVIVQTLLTHLGRLCTLS